MKVVEEYELVEKFGLVKINGFLDIKLGNLNVY